jgi:hypothetical protein
VRGAQFGDEPVRRLDVFENGEEWQTVALLCLAEQPVRDM